jgi:hypothetical protein
MKPVKRLTLSPPLGLLALITALGIFISKVLFEIMVFSNWREQRHWRYNKNKKKGGPGWDLTSNRNPNLDRSQRNPVFGWTGGLIVKGEVIPLIGDI